MACDHKALLNAAGPEVEAGVVRIFQREKLGLREETASGSSEDEQSQASPWGALLTLPLRLGSWKPFVHVIGLQNTSCSQILSSGAHSPSGTRHSTAAWWKQLTHLRH